MASEKQHELFNARASVKAETTEVKKPQLDVVLVAESAPSADLNAILTRATTKIRSLIWRLK